MKKLKTNYACLIHVLIPVAMMLVLIFSIPAFAVESVTLSPDSDIIFTKASDSRTLYVQVEPKEENLQLFIDVDTSTVTVSSEVLTTDADGIAEFTVTPGDENGMVFLSVSALGVESNAVVVTNEKQGETSTLTFAPDELIINWNNSPDSRASINIYPPKISNITIHNNNPELIFLPTTLSTNSSGSADLNILANKGGIATVTASLPDGTISNVLTIKIYTDEFIVTTPKNVELKTGGSADFLSMGGSGTFSWSCKDGFFDTLAGDEVTWTAPDYPGVFDIVVADNNRKTAVIRASVSAPLNIYPNFVYLTKGEKIEFRAFGGKPEYQFSVKGDSAVTIEPVEEHPEYAVITAPQANGVYTVLVQDSLSDQSEAVITVIDSMTLSRYEVEITKDPFEALLDDSPSISTTTIDFSMLETVTINDGKPPFAISVEKGDFRLINNVINIIPPVNNDTYNMTVRDALGDVKNVVIKTIIPGRLQIQPSNPEAAIGESITFNAVGGNGPYTFISSAGILSGKTDGKKDLAVENTDSDICVIVKDAAGATATASVKVIQAIHINPAESPTVLYAGESKKFKITGGSGKYFFSTDQGRADSLIDITGRGELIFTAPTHSGIITLTVTDTRNSTPASIEFEIKSVALTVTPSIRIMDLGAKGIDINPVLFDIISDDPNISYKVWTEFGRAEQKGTKIIYTPPAMACTDKIHIMTIPGLDSQEASQSAIAEIEIVQGLTISPSMLYLKNSEDTLSRTFTVLGGAGGYTLNAKYGDITPCFAEPGDKITYTSPGRSLIDEVIEVTDKTGGKTSAMVRVTNALKITPLMTTLAPGGEAEFTVLNGTPPYDAVASQGNRIESGQGKYMYTAPEQSGEYTITITDSANNNVTGIIYVTNSLKITPLLAVLRPGESTEIQPISGTAPYQFTATMGQLSSSASNGEAIIYTAPFSFEGETTEVYVKAYDSEDLTVATKITVIKMPKPVIFANSGVFTESDNFTVNLNLLGQGNADIYAALAMPDGTFLFFGQDGLPGLEFTPYKQNVDVSKPENSGQIISLSELPYIGTGTFMLYCLMTRPGESILEPNAWLGDLSIYNFEIK